jgi:hypothetical protein
MNKTWDWHGVIGTGQSLAVGAEGTPLRATRPLYRNLKLDLGLAARFSRVSDDQSSRLQLVPLVEPIRPLARGYPGPYPRNVYGETPHTAMATQITASFLAATAGAGDYVTVHSVVGESGQDLRTIGKSPPPVADTGTAYAASLFETRAISRLAKEAGRTFGIAAVVLTHGETDAENPHYAGGLFDLWQNYDSDLRAITGQSQHIPLLLTQQSSCPLEPGALASSALAALEACTLHPELTCVGPRYQYPYANDGVHLTALGYDLLGEKYGQVYFQRVVQGRDFRPLAPRGMKRAGVLVTVDFDVPVPPLAWDENLPSPHARRSAWAGAQGFEVSDGEAPIAVEAVELGPRSVTLRLSREATSRLVVRYAATANEEPRPGGARRWGRLRDSDPFVGATTGLPQANYAVTFELRE